MAVKTAIEVGSTPVQRPIVKLLPYQKADVESDARFTWSCWSRQVGKSFSKSLRRILRGIQRRRDQIFLSAGERQSRELMDKVRMHCQATATASGRRHWPSTPPAIPPARPRHSAPGD